MKQILTGMAYLNEECGILHRDLKPDNIMINLNPLVAKIIDFGHLGGLGQKLLT